MRKISLSKDIFIGILLAIYVVTPWYFEIAGISGINILAVMIIFASLLMYGMLKITFIKYRLIYICVAGWFLITSMSLWVNQAATEILFRFIRTILLFWALDRCCNNYKNFLNIIRSLVLGSGVISCFGIIEEITHFNIFSLLLRDGTELNYNPLRFGILRIISFSAQTIVFGVYLMFMLGLCIYILQFTSPKKKKIYITIYILLWVNLILTLSRSIIICTFFSQLFILFMQGNRAFFKKATKYLCIIIVVVGMAAFIVPQIGESLKMGLYMILAVFDDKYSSIISSSFGSDNLNALGNRLDLYEWVKASMNRKWLLGNGINAKFHYPYFQSNGLYTWIQYKDSIEVQYLNLLYRYGILGLIASVLTYISTLYTCIRGKLKKCQWEDRIGFNAICISTLCAYYIEFFAVFFVFVK